MARLARRIAGATAAVATIALAVHAVRPQMLESLRVRSFILSADKTAVTVGEPFHIVLRARVDERVAALDNVVLPNLAGLEDLGDERRCAPAKPGTECVETLTIDATMPGDRTIGPATLAVVDAATKRPRALSTNLVTVHITGQAKSPDETPAQSAVADILFGALRGLVFLLIVALALWALIWGLFRRRSYPSAPVEAPTVSAEPVTIDWESRMRELVAALRREPTRARAVAVRAALRERVGAREHETLADLVARDAANGHAATLEALSAVERAAFCEDARVGDAVKEALPFLSR